jgi:hypothetical protein
VSPVAIVTASDSGIGQESAKELAENGFDIPFSEYKNLIACEGGVPSGVERKRR